MSVLNTLGINGRNILINGGMDFWQRGQSVTGITSSATAMVADRWKIYTSLATGVLRCDQVTSVPNSTFSYSMKVACSTSQASVGAGETASIRHIIEGYNYALLSKSKRVTLSFWVMSNKTGIYNINLRNAGTDRSLLKEYTINASDTWEYKVISFDTCADGTWNITNGAGCYLQWTLACGSTYQGASDVWIADNKLGTANQVNFFSANTNTFYLTGVMLKEGEYSNPVFERAGTNITNELQLCQRYFEKSYDIDVIPGTSASGGSAKMVLSRAVTTSGTLMNTNFMVYKRTNNPAVTMYSTQGSAAGYVRNGTLGADRIAAVANVGMAGFEARHNDATGSADQALIYWQWTADAEL